MVFLERGFEIVEGFLKAPQLDYLARELSVTPLGSKSGGIRNADKKFPCIRELATSSKLIVTAKHYLGAEPQLVRAIYFNKTADNNWLVTWHQDRTVAVSRRFKAPGWGPWTMKDGVHHVQPPLDVLNQMVTVRIHLDDTGEDNGGLRLLPNSHRGGILLPAEIAHRTKTHAAVECPVRAGAALVMRPHILHASHKAHSDRQRRVIHLEYSGYRLPEGAEWG